MKAFRPSRGSRAKTDRIDAEIVACFCVFRPKTGRPLAEKLVFLRALISKRASWPKGADGFQSKSAYTTTCPRRRSSCFPSRGSARLQVRCRRRNDRDRRNNRRRGRSAHWGCAGGTRQRNPSVATVHRRRSPRPAARGGPGGLGRGPSQPVPEVLLRSPPQGRKAPQGHRHLRRRKTGSHRECVVEEPSETGDSHDLTDAVARSKSA